MLAITQVMPRAERGIGALATAVDGHWNSSIAGVVGSVASDRRKRAAVVAVVAMLPTERTILSVARWRSDCAYPVIVRPLVGRRQPDARCGRRGAGSAATRADGKESNGRGASRAGRRRALFPCSMTRIWSQSVSDPSRCETMIIVRPLAMRRRLALTTASLSGSSALVASSRMRMVGSWMRARAIARRCFCPPERLGEPSSM